VRWVTPEELQDGLTHDPRSYSPWLAGVAERLFAHLRADDAPERSGGR
jgi:isopentenyldiphosphate isomerase